MQFGMFLTPVEWHFWSVCWGMIYCAVVLVTQTAIMVVCVIFTPNFNQQINSIKHRTVQIDRYFLDWTISAHVVRHSSVHLQDAYGEITLQFIQLLTASLYLCPVISQRALDEIRLLTISTVKYHVLLYIIMTNRERLDKKETFLHSNDSEFIIVGLLPHIF